MRRILFFLALIIIAGLAFKFPAKVAAQNAAKTCELFPNPPVVTTNNDTIKLEIRTTGFVDGENYWLKLDNNFIGRINPGGTTTPQDFTNIGGLITVPKVDSGGVLDLIRSPSNFEPRAYTVTVQDPGSVGAVLCAKQFLVIAAPKPINCTIDFVDTPFTPDREVKIKVNGLTTNPNQQHRVIMKRNSALGNEVFNQCFRHSDLGTVASLQKHEIDTYHVQVNDSCDPVFSALEKPLCDVYVPVLPVGSTGGTTPIVGPIRGPVCTLTSSSTSSNPTYECKTAIGIINTSAIGFVTTMIMLILGVAGGIAFILIVYSGFKIIVSQGSPEAVQGARETLTSAIVGFLLIIFSIFILQFVTVDILAIPGFK